VTDAIVAAFYAELAESRHERLTMDKVAALNGNDYRQHDHGSLRADLIAYLRDGAKLLADPLVQRAMPYLIAQARGSPDLVQAFGQLPRPTRDDGRDFAPRHTPSWSPAPGAHFPDMPGRAARRRAPSAATAGQVVPRRGARPAWRDALAAAAPHAGNQQ